MEKTWLWIDPEPFGSPGLAKLKKQPGGEAHITLLFRLLLQAARKPYIRGRSDLVPCDKNALAEELGCKPEEVKSAVNAAYRAGLVRTITEKDLHGEGFGAAEARAPTLEEVRAYAAQEGLAVDPDRFYNWYAPMGFRQGKQLMDWKARLKSWAATELKRYNQTVSAARYAHENPAPIDMEELKKLTERI